MKRIFLGWLVLLSGLAFAPANPASAADLGTVNVTGAGLAVNASVTSLNAQVGDTFTIDNSSNSDISIRGPVTRTRGSRDCESSGTPWCVTTSNNSDTFTVNETGSFTISIYLGGSVGSLIATISLGAIIAPGGGRDDGSTTYKVTFDPNGGVCDGKSEPWNVKFEDSFNLTSRFDCKKDGHKFVGWTSDPLKTSDEDLIKTVVARSGTLTAVWRPTPPRLDVEVSGQGVVFSTELPGIVCGEGAFFLVTPVKYTNCGLDGAATRTLYAVPEQGQSFLGWGGACANTPITAACTVKVTGPTTAVARFGLVNLTVDKQGSGTVLEYTSSPRINCGATCSTGLLKDSSIVLVAAPAPGQYFVEWAGACAGTPATSACSLTVANDTKVTAVFAAGNRLVVDIAPWEGNNGLVWSVPYGLICGGPFEACAVTFPPTIGELTLFALDGRDRRLSGWGGACTGTATTSACSVSFAAGSKERRVAVSYEERRAWVPVATFDEAILSMSRDGRTVVTGTWSPTRVLRENSRTGEWKSLLELPDLTYSSILSGDGNTVVSCVDNPQSYLDVVVRRWNETSGSWRPLGATFETDSCPVVVSDDGSVISTRGHIYDWRAGSGSWVRRSNPKNLIFKTVNRQGTVAVFATLSPDGKLSYATYRWNADTSTWTRLDAIKGNNAEIYKISDDGRFMFATKPDEKNLNQIYDTVLKTWGFPTRTDDLGDQIRSVSPRGDSVLVVRASQAMFSIAVLRWEPITSRWVQYGGELENSDFGLISDGYASRVSIGKTIYEWSFPRR